MLVESAYREANAASLWRARLRPALACACAVLSALATLHALMGPAAHLLIRVPPAAAPGAPGSAAYALDLACREAADPPVTAGRGAWHFAERLARGAPWAPGLLGASPEPAEGSGADRRRPDTLAACAPAARAAALFARADAPAALAFGCGGPPALFSLPGAALYAAPGLWVAGGWVLQIAAGLGGGEWADARLKTPAVVGRAALPAAFAILGFSLLAEAVAAGATTESLCWPLAGRYSHDGEPVPAARLPSLWAAAPLGEEDARWAHTTAVPAVPALRVEGQPGNWRLKARYRPSQEAHAAAKLAVLRYRTAARLVAAGFALALALAMLAACALDHWCGAEPADSVDSPSPRAGAAAEVPPPSPTPADDLEWAEPHTDGGHAAAAAAHALIFALGAFALLALLYLAACFPGWR